MEKEIKRISSKVNRTRPLWIYIVLTCIFSSVLLVLLIQHTGWGIKTNSVGINNEFRQEPRDILPNRDLQSSGVVSIQKNIHQFISSQMYYQTLCELDR